MKDAMVRSSAGLMVLGFVLTFPGLGLAEGSVSPRKIGYRQRCPAGYVFEGNSGGSGEAWTQSASPKTCVPKNPGGGQVVDLGVQGSPSTRGRKVSILPNTAKVVITRDGIESVTPPVSLRGNSLRADLNGSFNAGDGYFMINARMERPVRQEIVLTPSGNQQTKTGTVRDVPLMEKSSLEKICPRGNWGNTVKNVMAAQSFVVGTLADPFMPNKARTVNEESFTTYVWFDVVCKDTYKATVTERWKYECPAGLVLEGRCENSLTASIDLRFPARC